MQAPVSGLHFDDLIGIRSMTPLVLLAGLLVAYAAVPADLGGRPISRTDNAGLKREPQLIRGAKHDVSDWDYVGRWGAGSAVSLIEHGDWKDAWRCIAAPKTDRVGKAYVTKNFPAVTRGEVVEAQARYLIENIPETGSIYLMDFECRYCGPKGKAGIRLLLNNGRLRVNRTKLGLGQDFVSTVPRAVPAGKPFTLAVRLLLGGEDGETTVLVDNQPVLHAVGINMPLRKVAAQQGLELKQEQLDYVQFGVTANSTPDTVRLLFTDAAITSWGVTPD
jgi:hypothetical protein